MSMELKGQVTGFLDFISERGVLGLAMGFIMGGAVSKVTTSLSTDIINPALANIFGSTNHIADIMVGQIAVGKFMAAIIDFLVFAVTLYVLFKVLRLDRLDKPKT